MEYSEVSTSVHNQIAVSNFLELESRKEIVAEITAGLFTDPKYISSRFFYDDRGSSLFQRITTLPEYYPTRTEKAILSKVSGEITAGRKGIDMIELGSGDFSKISILMEAIPERDLSSVRYFPVDVSESAVHHSAEGVSRRYPDVMVHGLLADFIKHLTSLPGEGHRLVCFFGSTIGNFSRARALQFVTELKKIMAPGDELLLGLDMEKDQQILEAAYNDREGVTESFNKNLLHVVNGIAETNFNPADFEHLAFYNRNEKRIEMHLKAKQEMEITSPCLPHPVKLRKGETIHTENSHKFTREHIRQFAERSGLSVKKIYSDRNNWFSLVHFVYTLSD
jgi:L-histidine N-alpha-methyltransferase